MSTPQLTCSVVSDSDEDENCPICMDSLPESSKKYPILCPSENCESNMCSTCLRSLFQSSHSGDNNSGSSANARVRVQCPMCRGDLKRTTRDTLLLRDSHDAELLQDLDDDKLTASQQRLKYILDDPEMLGKITAAKRNYETVKGDNGVEVLMGSGMMYCCGTAADSADFLDLNPDELDIGFEEHNDDEYLNGSDRSGPVVIDKNIFGGLESLMSLSEQESVHILMTSGNPDFVAQAAETLRTIANMAAKGISPQTSNPTEIMKVDSLDSLSFTESPVRRTGHKHQRRFSYTEANRSIATPTRDSPPPLSRQKYQRRFSYTSTTSSRSQNVLTERQREEEKNAEFKRLHPLPVRLPRSVSIDLEKFGEPDSRNCIMSFVDDLESYLEVQLGEKSFDEAGDLEVLHQDIIDAFQRISFDWYGNIQKVPMDENLRNGVGKIIEVRDIEFRRSIFQRNTRKTSPKASKTCILPSSRIVITKAKSPLAQLGIQVGDVITHINGEPFNGNAEQLRLRISNMQKEFSEMPAEAKTSNNQLKIGVNAEKNVCEVLRLRTLY